MRYGHQQDDVIKKWPRTYLFEIRDALNRIVARENESEG